MTVNSGFVLYGAHPACLAPEPSHSAVMTGKFETKYKPGKRYDAPGITGIFTKLLNCVICRSSFLLVNALMPRDEMWCCILC